MISLKKYLDLQQVDSDATAELADGDLLPAVVDAYGSALLEMGNASLDACPGMGGERGLSDHTSQRHGRGGDFGHIGPGHRAG